MDRDTALRFGLAALACLAIAVGAATLANPVETGGEGVADTGVTGARDGTPTATTDASETATRQPGVLAAGRTRPCPFKISDPLIGIGFFVGLGLVIGIAYRYRLPRVLGLAGVAGPVLGLVVLLLYSSSGCSEMAAMNRSSPGAVSGAPANAGNASGGGGGVGVGTQAGDLVTLPSALFALFLIGTVAATFVALMTLTGDQHPEEDERGEEETTVPDVEAVGEVAGDAADRIEAAGDLENEVYRAWHEMVEHLEVENPDSSTPAEFAAAAVDAGMAPEDVDELTTLFEEVRYGGADVTAEREERAVAALRRIERTYAGGDGA